MTDIAKELLENVSEGDYVSLYYGTGTNQKDAIGVVDKISGLILKLRKDDGHIVSINLEDLRSIEVISTDNTKDTDDESDPVGQPSTLNTPITKDSIVEEIENTDKNKNEEEIEATVERLNAGGEDAPEETPIGEIVTVSRERVSLPADSVFSFTSKDLISEIRGELKSIQRKELKKTIEGCLDSLNYAITNHAVEEKYHGIRQKILAIQNSCESQKEFDITNFTLGALATIAGDYKEALDPLINARQFYLASYVSQKNNFLDDAEIYLILALLTKENGANVTQSTSEILIKRKDSRALIRLLDIYIDNQDVCELLYTCAYNMYVASDSVPTEDVTNSDDARAAAIKLINFLPDNYKEESEILNKWSILSTDSSVFSPVEDSGSEDSSINENLLVQTGTILMYSSNKNFGFIRINEGENIYFRVAQVYDNTDSAILLRKFLFLEQQAKGLEVSFIFGTNRDGRPAASDIDLTSKGYQVAQRRAKNMQRPDFYHGNIVHFEHSFNQKKEDRGIIESNGKKYDFKLSDVVDPYLRKFCELSFLQEDQAVRFEVNGSRATKICWDAKDPDSEDFKSISQEVDNDEIKSWNDYKKREKNLTVNALPVIDPYLNYKFTALPPFDDTQTITRSKTVINGNTIKKNSRRKATKEAQEKQKDLAAQAHKFMQDGNLDEAIQKYEQALEAADFNESIVNNLITTYLRQNNIDKALSTFNTYESNYENTKAINIKKQIYERAKDYEALCPLYQEAYKIAPTLMSKSHNLYCLANVYIKLGKYQDALETCNEWEKTYRQNQYARDAERLKTVVPNITRFKAICYYHLDKRDEAKEIATDLVRANPADATALAILNDSLGEALSSESYDELDDSSFIDDFEEEESKSSIPSTFFRVKILNTDISEFLKNTHIDGTGRYIGTQEEAYNDVDTLIKNASSMAAGNRSEYLFASCRLIEIIDQSTDYRIQRNKLRLSGRAASYYSDNTVTQSNDTETLDSARMGYLYAIKVLGIPPKWNRNRRIEPSWSSSYNRFIRSFFWSQTDLKNYINQQTISTIVDDANADILEEGLPNPVIPLFMVGMMDLCDALKKQQSIREKFLQELYDKNTELRISVVQRLNNVYGIEVEETCDLEQFKVAFQDGCKARRDKLDSLTSMIRIITDDFMSSSLSRDIIDAFAPEDWEPYLCDKDQKRLGKIHRILNLLQNYFGQGATFEIREESLTGAINIMWDLIKEIREMPTELSYEIFLPGLEQVMINKLVDLREKLYENFQPALECSESIQPFRMPDDLVRIQLLIENKRNYQTANNFKITSVSGDNQAWNTEETSQNIRGGDEQEFIVDVKLNEDANASGSFNLTIWYSYLCSESPDKPQKEKSERYDHTFYIHNESCEKIKDPFISCATGNVVIEPEMFYGRTEEIDEIINQVISSDSGEVNYNQAIAIYGQTRTGKSSILYHLKEKMKNTYGDQILIWDMGNIGNVEVSEGQDYLSIFLRSMIQKADHEIKRPQHQHIQDLINNAGIISPLDDMRKFPDQTVELFNSYMDQLSETLRANNCIIVLLIDEFTYLHGLIKSGKLSTSFMQFWKAMLQNYAIFSVVAGTDNMPEFLHDYQNEFACMKLQKVTYLDEKFAKELIQQPLSRENNNQNFFKDDGTVDEIFELTAGSAYLTTILCSNLVSYINEKTAYIITKGSFNDFLNTKAFGGESFLDETRFESQVKEKGHEEYDVPNREILLSIARNSLVKGYATIEEISCKDYDEEIIQMLVNRLVDRQVLKKKEQGYYIWVKLLERWLIWRYGKE